MNEYSERVLLYPEKTKTKRINERKWQEETHKVLYYYSVNTMYKEVLLLINFYDRNAAELKSYMHIFI